MGKPGDINTRELRSFTGLGPGGDQTAHRAIDVIAVGGDPVQGAAGAGGAGAAVDLVANDLQDRDVLLSALGITYFRLDAAPTALIWHFALQVGQTVILHIGRHTTLQGWGIGGAWAYNLTPVDDV